MLLWLAITEVPMCNNKFRRRDLIQLCITTYMLKWIDIIQVYNCSEYPLPSLSNCCHLQQASHSSIRVAIAGLQNRVDHILLQCGEHFNQLFNIFFFHTRLLGSCGNNKQTNSNHVFQEHTSVVCSYKLKGSVCTIFSSRRTCPMDWPLRPKIIRCTCTSEFFFFMSYDR